MISPLVMPIDSAGRPGASRITNFVFDTLIGSTVRTLDRIDLVLGDNDVAEAEEAETENLCAEELDITHPSGLRTWFLSHLADPFPALPDKRIWARNLGTTTRNIDSHMTNWRRRAGWTAIKKKWTDGTKDGMRTLVNSYFSKEETRPDVRSAIKKMCDYLDDSQVGDWMTELLPQARPIRPLPRQLSTQPQDSGGSPTSRSLSVSSTTSSSSTTSIASASAISSALSPATNRVNKRPPDEDTGSEAPFKRQCPTPSSPYRVAHGLLSTMSPVGLIETPMTVHHLMGTSAASRPSPATSVVENDGPGQALFPSNFGSSSIVSEASAPTPIAPGNQLHLAPFSVLPQLSVLPNMEDFSFNGSIDFGGAFPDWFDLAGESLLSNEPFSSYSYINVDLSQIS